MHMSKEASFALRGRVVLPETILLDGLVVVNGSHLLWVGEAEQAAAAGFARELEQASPAPEGGYLLPGLIDVHCHGGGGESFPNATTREQAMTAVLEHRRHGTTTIVTSCVTASPEVLRERTKLLADLADEGEIAGIHYEGPFVSVERCGAQDPTYIIDPDAELTRELLQLGRGHVVTMTIAPEKPVRRCLEETDRRIWSRLATDKPVRSERATATHLFNGMRPIHHRDPGPVPEVVAGAQRGEVIAELIGDGVHLAPAIVRDLFDTLGPANLVLITDAMAAAGMADGSYVLGSQPVTVADGVARLTEGGAIAGGTAHLIDVVRTTWHSGVALEDAVYAASVQGAEILGDPARGELAAGLIADVVITDCDLNPVEVYRAGQLVK